MREYSGTGTVFSVSPAFRIIYEKNSDLKSSPITDMVFAGLSFTLCQVFHNFTLMKIGIGIFFHRRKVTRHVTINNYTGRSRVKI